MKSLGFLGFLPQSDAVIFVTSVDTSLTRAETDFLQRIREYVRKIFFVVNKVDLAADNERQQILDFISETLKRKTRADEVRIFPVSSTTALTSRLEGNGEEYERSGLKSLQEALSEFLSNEKSNALLISILDKVLRLAAGASHQLQLHKVAGETSPEEIRKKLAEVLQTPEGRKEYQYSQGVCLRHLGILIPMVFPKEVVKFLLEHAARRFAEISEDMQNYALKRDALRGHTKNPDEDDAYLRGIIHNVGAKKLSFPWELSAEG